MADYLILIFGIGAILSAFFVISSNNPVNSIFSLVLAFINTSLILLLFGIDFLSLLLIIVYVGAIAILFLFVIMMLNIKLVEISDNASRYVPVGIVIGLVFMIELIYLIKSINPNLYQYKFFEFINYTNFNLNSNIKLVGQVLYTDYWEIFIISSIILLVAMIGAILLTLSHDLTIHRQDLFTQTSTDFNKTIKKHVI